jgi:hypothetical protein
MLEFRFRKHFCGRIFKARAFVTDYQLITAIKLNTLGQRG